MKKYFVPIFTALLCAAQGCAAFLPWKYLGKSPVNIESATLAMALLGLVAIVLFMVGKYSSGLARIAQHRLLSAGANYALLAAYASFAIIVSIGFAWPI